MTSELTSKQQAIYDYIQSHIEDQHAPPSLREIGAHFDLSVGTVQDQVEAIRRKGFIHKEHARARGLRIPLTAFQVSVLGQIHAGPLHMAFENVEGYLPVGGTLSPSRHFALRIKGDSMREAGLLDGDMVIVRIQETADEGDIVVARVEEETTVKYLRKKGPEVFLEPANPLYKPIKGVPFSVAGVVVEARRQYTRMAKVGL